MGQRVSRADMSEKNPKEWATGTRAARRARKHVATQLTEQIEQADLTGSADLVRLRVSDYAEAIRSGDPVAERAALMDLAAAAGATAAGIDLKHPPLAVL